MCCVQRFTHGQLQGRELGVGMSECDSVTILRSEERRSIVWVRQGQRYFSFSGSVTWSDEMRISGISLMLNGVGMRSANMRSLCSLLR
jgi:hypothetical protein